MSSQKADQATIFGLGQSGIEIVSGAASGVAGPWVAIQCITDTIFSAWTALGTTGTVTGITYPAHFIIRAPITAFTLTSGDVVATKGNIVN